MSAVPDSARPALPRLGRRENRVERQRLAREHRTDIYCRSFEPIIGGPSGRVGPASQRVVEILDIHGEDELTNMKILQVLTV